MLWISFQISILKGALYDNVHTGTMASTNYRYLDIIKNSLNGNNSEVHMNKIVWTDLFRR